MHVQSRLDTYFNKDIHRTVQYFLVYDKDKEKKDFKNVMSFRGIFVQFTRQWRIIDNGESLVKILQNFLNLRQNIIYYITQSFTFIYALMFCKRMGSKFHRTIKLGLLKGLTP